MKKTYINPQMLVVRIAPTTVVALSIVVDATKTGSSALTKEENNWDIWGGDDNDWDE